MHISASLLNMFLVIITRLRHIVFSTICILSKCGLKGVAVQAQ